MGPASPCTDREQIYTVHTVEQWYHLLLNTRQEELARCLLPGDRVGAGPLRQENARNITKFHGKRDPGRPFGLWCQREIVNKSIPFVSHLRDRFPRVVDGRRAVKRIFTVLYLGSVEPQNSPPVQLSNVQ